MQIGGVSRKKMIHNPKQPDLMKKVQFHCCAVYLINCISTKIMKLCDPYKLIRHEYEISQ